MVLHGAPNVLRMCSGCAPDVCSGPAHAHALPAPNGTPSTRANMPGHAQCAHCPTHPPTARSHAHTGTKNRVAPAR
eukprot:1437004-Prymnesium_polylepis.1